jgi:hypothetical protein
VCSGSGLVTRVTLARAGVREGWVWVRE